MRKVRIYKRIFSQRRHTRHNKQAKAMPTQAEFRDPSSEYHGKQGRSGRGDVQVHKQRPGMNANTLGRQESSLVRSRGRSRSCRR